MSKTHRASRPAKYGTWSGAPMDTVQYINQYTVSGVVNDGAGGWDHTCSVFQTNEHVVFEDDWAVIGATRIYHGIKRPTISVEHIAL